MPTRRLTVTISQPCHEDWSAMTPELQGRFCGSCQKTVIDFSSMSDAEVVKLLSHQEGRTCGRFSNKQLERELVSVSTPRNRWTWKAVALGLSAWLSAKAVETKASDFSPTIEQQKQTALTEQASTLKTALTSDSLLSVRGVVIDAQTKEGMPAATVLLKGTSIATQTDINGHFSLNLPEELRAKDPVIEFSFIGNMVCEKKLSELQTSSLATTIKMSPDIKGMLETVIVGGAFSYKWYSPRSLYYKARNLFRN